MKDAFDQPPTAVPDSGVLSSCNVDDDFIIDLSQKKTFLQLNYIEIALQRETEHRFELRKQLSTGKVIVKHFSLDTAPETMARVHQILQLEILFHKIRELIPELLAAGSLALLQRWLWTRGLGDGAWLLRPSHIKTSTFGTEVRTCIGAAPMERLRSPAGFELGQDSLAEVHRTASQDTRNVAHLHERCNTHS